MRLGRLLSVVVGWGALACGQVTGGAGESSSPAAVEDEGRAELADVPSTEVPDQGSSPPHPLCDGSADVRFLYVSTGGFVEVPFLYRSGSRFLAIDGQCRYWLGEANLEGLRGGELEPERAQVIARDLQYGQYASVPSYAPQACDDCGSTILVDDTGMIGRGSGEPSDEPAPQVWSAAMRAAAEVVAELREEAVAVTPASKTLLALRTARSDVLGVVPLDLETRALDPDSLELFADRPEHWVVVEDAATIDLLAELQRAALLADPTARTVFAQDVEGRHYEVLVRDEPPAPVAAALDEALLRNLP
jgi:hypothetical protein